MWLLIWFVILLLVGAGMVFQVMIISDLLDFEADCRNPLDLCCQLDSRVMPILVIEGVAAVLTLGDLRRSWALLIGRLAIILVTLKMRTRKRFFDPMTIVRDMSKIKIRHAIFAGIGVISVVWTLLAMVFTLFS